MQRRFAAILVADIVGYSAMMEQDEAGTLELLKRARDTVVLPLVAKHGGRVFKETGDGFLIEFERAREAVLCAVAWQRHEGWAGMARRLSFRIGVNIGDVVRIDGDVFGSGVNLAARLEALAEPGGVCVSDAVHERCAGELPVTFANQGEHLLKNLSTPVRVWQWVWGGGAPKRTLNTRRPRATSKPAIAVLPLDNLSGGDAEAGAFADGLCEDIIVAMSRFSRFEVVARDISFGYRGQPVGIRQIAADLDVRYVLAGSIRKAGQRIRVSVQLVDARSGKPVWTERYDRALDDVFAVQDEIVRHVTSVIGEAVWFDVSKNITGMEEADYGPYELAYRAAELAHRMTPGDTDRAIAMCRRAVEMAPDFAFAHFGVGATTFYVWLFWGGHAGDVAQTVPASAARLAELEPNDAETIRLLCLLSLMRGDHQTAIGRSDEAISLNPNDVDLTTTRGVCLMFDGAFEAAERHFETVMTLHSQTPQATDITRAFLGLAQFVKGEVEAAAGTARAIDGFEMGQDLVLAACCADRGDHEHALDHARALTTRYPNFAVGDVGACRMFREERHRRRLADALRQAGLPG